MGQPQPDPRASGGEWAAAVKLGSAEETGSAAAGSWGSMLRLQAPRLTWVAAGNVGERGRSSALGSGQGTTEEVAGSSLVAESIRGRSWFSWLPGRVLAGADFGDGTVEEEELSSLAWSKRDWLGLAEACPCEVEVRCRQRIERTGTVVKFLRTGSKVDDFDHLLLLSLQGIGDRQWRMIPGEKLHCQRAEMDDGQLLLASCRLLACRCGSAGLPLQRRLTC
ncbi:hypothetical protein MLD38_029890 [Melastoma candidum]|uniref:Uncharacterized protein n=1 Tax=Melastoma candidum TaxID=119954 RepID=A0ACB9N584_9MYRT|nr:hypothetical protein MLD38_029890 [Melastoma candidum]